MRKEGTGCCGLMLSQHVQLIDTNNRQTQTYIHHECVLWNDFKSIHNNRLTLVWLPARSYHLLHSSTFIMSFINIKNT